MEPPTPVTGVGRAVGLLWASDPSPQSIPIKKVTHSQAFVSGDSERPRLYKDGPCPVIDTLDNPEERNSAWPSGEGERQEQREASGWWVGG